MFAGKLRKHSTGRKPLFVTTKSAAGKRCGTFTVSSRNGEMASGKTGEAGVRLCTRSPQVQKSAQEGRATGAIVFHAFPQEALDKLLEETGGRPIQLHLPELPDGEIVFDDSGNVYRVERIQLEGGQIQERRLFLFRMTDHGDIILDGVRVDSVQPFAMQEGSGEIRNGMVTFSNVPQHPTVRTRKARVLRSREDRQEFLTSCEKTLGPSFSVFVDGDPRSIRQLDTDSKKQAFLERAPVRPWESRPFQGTAVQQ